MSELRKQIKEAGIDEIIDDQEFVEVENSFIREYCKERKFNISKEDMKEIENRGMVDGFNFWKSEYEAEHCR